MRKKYIDWDPRDSSIRIIDEAESIIDEYELAGYTLTLRQLYYQFVARDLIPNTERSYKNLGAIITKARMAGLISWEAIEDRNREHHEPYTQEDEFELLSRLPYHIQFDQWERQDFYVEVWVEKEALGNVIERACNPYMVPYMSCKGYLSASEAWRAGRRFLNQISNGKQCVLIHLGDHDPSGLDMTRDNRERVELFSEFPGGVDVKRIALNRDQVDEHRPPPNPTKVADSRAKDYMAEFGRTSWELDALDPSVIESLITEEITALIDFEVWEETERKQTKKRRLLKKLYEQWDTIREGLED